MNNAKYSILIAFLSCLLFSCKTQSQDVNKNGAYINNIDVVQFKEKMNNSDVVILDVRTVGEVEKGSIEGMKHIDINGNEWKTEIAKLDKNKEYLVYCKSGGRSAKACTQMNKEGFTKLNNLLGGYTAWAKK